MDKIESYIKNGYYDSKFADLYTDVEKARKRYLNAVFQFNKAFGCQCNLRLFSAPGRTEIGGNHTDHQHGCVLTSGIDLDIIAVVSSNDHGIIQVISERFDDCKFNISDISLDKLNYGKSIALIKGMCSEFKNAGYNIGGFYAYTTSDILCGSGLSSSAAFEVLIGNILNNLYNDGMVSNIEIAKFAQRAESVYFGKPCGLMDQMACSIGGFTAMDFKDPDIPIVEKIHFNFKTQDYKLIIVNTGGSHSDLTADYAEIFNDCKIISKYFNASYLRDVSENMFYKSIGKLRTYFGDRAVLRAIHFFDENKRAINEKIALSENRFNDFLKLVNMSGKSSFEYLQNTYSVNNPKEQGISLALALSEKILSIDGAYRVHGGGFAGTIQAFVPIVKLNEYIEKMESVFGINSCYILESRSKGCTEILF